MDIAVVHQERIREPGQTRKRLVVNCGDGFLGIITAGHDERRAGKVRLQEQVVERGIGEHQAQILDAGRYEGRNGRFVSLPQQHDGPLTARQQRAFLLTHVAERGNRVQVEGHQGKGLVHPSLPLPQ